MHAIYKKELKAYFSNMLGYIFIAFILLLTGILCSIVNFKGLYASFESSLATLSIIFLIAIPILTMRIIAEEKSQKTDQLLYSLPIPVYQIVLAKFFAMITVFIIPVGIMSIYPLILMTYGPVYLTATYTAIIGFALFGISLISIGMFASSVTESQIISAVISFLAILLMFLSSMLKSAIPSTPIASFLCFAALIALIALILYFMTKNYTVAICTAFVLEMLLVAIYSVNPYIFEGAFASFLDWFSVYDRFTNFLYGIFDINSLVYYLTFIAVFVFLTVQSVEKKRWS